MLDGVVGAVIGALVGGLVSLLIARLVLDQTRRDNADLAREQASLAAAKALGLGLLELESQLHRIRRCGALEAAELVRNASDSFEIAIVAHAPALRNASLREAVEEVHKVLLNFSYFALRGEKITDGWASGDRILADVQRADYITLVRDALTAYRQGGRVVIRGEPGWRMVRKGQWAWRIPPGNNVDGSGEADDGWTPLALDGHEFWVKRS
jgi:hypothetical protein